MKEISDESGKAAAIRGKSMPDNRVHGDFGGLAEKIPGAYCEITMRDVLVRLKVDLGTNGIDSGKA
jgi:hypothetical protein